MVPSMGRKTVVFALVVWIVSTIEKAYVPLENFVRDSHARPHLGVSDSSPIGTLVEIVGRFKEECQWLRATRAIA
jgi:hypothetical protein